MIFKYIYDKGDGVWFFSLFTFLAFSLKIASLIECANPLISLPPSYSDAKLMTEVIWASYNNDFEAFWNIFFCIWNTFYFIWINSKTM